MSTPPPGPIGAVSTRERLLPFILAAAIIGADQIIKAVAVGALPLHQPQEGIGDLVRFTLVQNPAIGFSIGHNWPEGLRRVLFLILPLAVLVLIVSYYFRTNELSRGQRWLVCALIGGGLGNYVDRLFRPDGVVDFVDVKFFGIFGLNRWPTFNLADSTVVVASIILLITFFRDGLRERAQSQAQGHAEPQPPAAAAHGQQERD